MSRYIDAESFFEEFEELDKEPYNNYPTADVRENVKGHWIRFKNIAECSNCKAVWYDNLDLITKSWSFCPNCGADMRGEA